MTCSFGKFSPMKLEDEYRKHAADSLDLACKQANGADKSRLLLMTEAWLNLADRIAGRFKKRQAIMEDPMVERVLGREPPDPE